MRMMIRTPLICLALLWTAGVQGATETTYTGPVDGEITDPANWDSGDPSSGSFIATFAGQNSGSGPLFLSMTNAFGDVAGGTALNLAAGQTESVTLTNAAGEEVIFRLISSETAAALNLAAGAGSLTLGGGGDAIQLMSGAGAGAKTFILNNDSASLAAFGSNVRFGAGGGQAQTIRFTGSGAGGFDVAGSLVSNQGGGNVAVEIDLSADGAVRLSGNNASMTGDVTVAQGTLRTTQAAALGHASSGAVKLEDAALAFESSPFLIDQSQVADTPVGFVEGIEVERTVIASSWSEPFMLSDPDRPGMWCWYQDPRAIVDTSDPERPLVLAGVVTFGPIGSDQRGDIDLYWANLATVGTEEFERGRFELEDQLQMDDHDSPGLMIRPDGRYLATWTMHGTAGSSYPASETQYLRYRISTHPGDPTEWGPLIKQSVMDGGGICYTHPYYLSEGNHGEPVVFNATRSWGFDSHLMYSDDQGETWRRSGWLMDQPDPWPHDGNGGRSYVKYAGDGVSRVYIIITDDHPHVNFNSNRTLPGPYLNSVYAGYIENDKLYRMDGTVADDNLTDQNGTPPTHLTPLLKDGTEVAGVTMRRGWQNDIRVMPDGHPVATFQFRGDDDADRHHFFYARFDGTQLNVHYLAHAGSFFGGAGQPDYTGLSTVDAMNPDIVYISTSRHPITGEELISSTTGRRQHEIYMGRTTDGGATWQWNAVTENSAADNIRPFSPAWKEGTSMVIWMQGNYPSFYVYDTMVMGQIFELN